LILSAWVIIGYFNWGFTVIGWPSLIASILFIGGINMIILGIMGAYISRIFQEVKRRPLYIIKDELK
jgi:glycosyltransferase involved in cell wall biosynthesis